jgi:hypothetical protein
VVSGQRSAVSGQWLVPGDRTFLSGFRVQNPGFGFGVRDRGFRVLDTRFRVRGSVPKGRHHVARGVSPWERSSQLHKSPEGATYIPATSFFLPLLCLKTSDPLFPIVHIPYLLSLISNLKSLSPRLTFLGPPARLISARGRANRPRFSRGPARTLHKSTHLRLAGPNDFGCHKE